MRQRYTLPALADLGSILDYIADRSPQGAERIHARIRAITEPLLGVFSEFETACGHSSARPAAAAGPASQLRGTDRAQDRTPFRPVAGTFGEACCPRACGW